VLIHIWIVFLCFGLFPGAITLYRKFYPITVESLFEQNSITASFFKMQLYGFWLLVCIGHVFFIATIVKSFSPKKETITDEQAPGLLDEFAE
jgi:hypothetical protein